MSGRDAAPGARTAGPHVPDLTEGDGDEPAGRQGGTGWVPVDRLLRRHSLRQSVACYRRHAVAPGRTRWTPGRVAAVGIGATLRLALLAGLGLGGWLCTRHFPGLGLVAGLLVCAFAVALWPRRPRVSRYATAVDAAAAPHLHRLTQRIAAAVGVAEPHLIHLDDGFHAQALIWGPLRRRHLVIGIPLLAALSPEQRVALLALHLARFRVTDPATEPLAGGVDTTIDTLDAALSLGSHGIQRNIRDTRIIEATLGTPRAVAPGTSGLVWVAEMLLIPVTAPLRGLLGALWLLYTITVRPATHAAGYAADAVATTVAGTAATLDVLDIMISADAVTTRLGALARTRTSPAAWPAAAADFLADTERRHRLREAGARRETSAFSTQPPLGLRAMMLASRSPAPATQDLDDAASQGIDAELATYYRKVSRDLAHGASLT
ncbi:hypothetical protein [Dactylosporangium sp. NPDC048998]|uniref:hypothetical protein n=1 Tax=Dactylosporangium sp. NPDC048998 TaxID=3363976 RepID=UPI00371A0233